MEPDGIVNAWTMSVRMTRARRTAMAIASPYSRTRDLRRGAAVIVTGAGIASPFSTCRVRQFFSTARNASWGTSTRPTCFMRFLPSFCLSSSLRLRVMSPP